jgi:putative CocE/NonD family hydrolase
MIISRCALFFVLPLLASAAADEFDVQNNYAKTEYRIAMRDGVKLYTAVYIPRAYTGSLPILLTRTPYGTGPYGPENYPKRLGPLGFAQEKFIFALQDVRGRFMSEGEFVDVRPIKDVLTYPTDTDETTDTYDTIDWLVKNVPGNNGKVGMMGTSYNGYYTTCGLIRSHPALAAASPQAPMADLYRGDDAYHNGAFFLVANFSFYTGFNKQKNPVAKDDIPPFDYGTNDSYQFYLAMGPLADSDRLYLLNHNPYWTDMYVHTTEDSYWRARHILPHLKGVTAAVLVVGGWYDAEDLSGTLMTYEAIRRQSPSTLCKLSMGPWPHGAWNFGKGDKLGDINFDADTADALRAEELEFFKRYLKDSIAAEQPQAFVFTTGTNQWKALTQWPPPTVQQRLYLQAGGKLSLRPPAGQPAFDEYLSDPANPVPYLPNAPQDMVKEYMTADQRFLSNRKDVVSYLSDLLSEDVTIAGPISPDLFVSTSGTDSDFDVKLIDVYPADAPGSLAGYQQLVRGEPFRGKFRKSFAKPEPFLPGKIEEVRFSMPDVYHCFKKGHRIMVQVQSSWFPLTDRNPQTFGDIPNAKATDFVAANERIYHTSRNPSYVEVNVEPKVTPREPAVSR